MASRRKMEARRKREAKRAAKKTEQLTPGRQSRYAAKQRKDYPLGFGMGRMRRLREAPTISEVGVRDDGTRWAFDRSQDPSGELVRLRDVQASMEPRGYP